MTSDVAAPHRTLQWTAQFDVLPRKTTPSLRGDKIILPPSALENLLSAATTFTHIDSPTRSATFDPYNPYTFDAERNIRTTHHERRQDLPHPLTFRLVEPVSGAVVYAGIREFSAEEGTIGLSPFLRRSLGLDDKQGGLSDGDTSGQKITVHVQELQKGTFVKLRPLEAGYDPQDWKALLERSLRDNFTTLTHGEILCVTSGHDEFRFLVDELKPDKEAVSIIDTDLEVDIEALNEEQARETLKQRLQKQTVIPSIAGGSSADAVIEADKIVSGQVVPGSFVHYTLESLEKHKGVQVEVVPTGHDGEVDLFVSPSGPRQRARPTYEDHVFADMSSISNKRLKIAHTNAALEGAEALWISVSASALTTPGSVPQAYELRVSTSDVEGTDRSTTLPDQESHDDETQCRNCRQWVPQRTLFLHENFCLRNNVLCPQCSNVFQKSSPEWKDHWHCPHDTAYGNSAASKVKHDTLFHTPQICKSCGYQVKSIPELAHHRTTLCPEKQILCSFCHLVVSQQGPDDPDILDPEVILSGLTPHEVSDGARTTECHLCNKIVRLRDMNVHLKHHDLARLSRVKPRVCRNVNCGRLLDAVSKTGEVHPSPKKNDLWLCDTCFGPLYVSSYDPDGKALKRRVERRYFQQLLTGCGQTWCSNEFCKVGRQHRDGGAPAVASKDAIAMSKPYTDNVWEEKSPLHFCTDETSQSRRSLAEMMASEKNGLGGISDRDNVKGGYELEWCVASLIENNDMEKAWTWLGNFAAQRGEVR